MSGHVHLTPLGGLAGDMFVAAMLDAFPDLVAPVIAAASAVLPLAPPRLTPCQKAGLAAMGFSVPPQGDAAPLHFTDMDGILADAPLGDATRAHARALLRLLAEAEAAVHDVPLSRVHFHEIADWDTLADLTAAAALFEALDGWGWSLDPLPLGGGTVKTAHGRLPVPAPATARLLQGLAVHDDGIAGERVTPTGAAIARYIHETRPLCPRPMGRLLATGYGAGTRDLPGLANVAVAQAIGLPVQAGDTVTLLEWEIDDMTGEEIATACDRLRAVSGVLDLVTQPMAGKKGRPVTGFRLMARPGQGDAIATEVFAQTSTLGLRLHSDRRLVLPRAVQPGVKQAIRPHGTTAKAESDDLSGAPTLAARRARAREVEG